MDQSNKTKYYYSVEFNGGIFTGFLPFEPSKRLISDPYLLADDCAEDFEEKNPGIAFPITVYLYNKDHKPMGSFKVEKRIEVSYLSERII